VARHTPERRSASLPGGAVVELKATFELVDVPTGTK
jgi:hypothetical protein